MYASLGFTVVVMDGRGSGGRGVQHEAHLRRRLGAVELADQVEGLEYVATLHQCTMRHICSAPCDLVCVRCN
jgi:dipeptidyl aminopeptidase/acylaminoacyl peptidase